MEAIRRFGANAEITRFKGLGEISPDEFRGFIGPDMRLDRVTLRKDDGVSKLLEFYMGKIPPTVRASSSITLWWRTIRRFPERHATSSPPIQA